MGQRTDAYRRLYDEYKCLCLISQGELFDRIRMAELVGKVAFAAEYELITPEEWETLFGKIYKTVYGV